MTVDTIIKNWSDYDRKKKLQQRDTRSFDYSADWEVTYFCNKIKAIYPFIPEPLIKESIKTCAQRLTGACSREAFAEDVLRRLGIPL